MKNPSILLILILISSSCMSSKTTSDNGIVIADSARHELGEGALWDAKFNRLFYVDITGKKLFVNYPETNIINKYDMPSMIGTVVCHSEKEMLVALEDGIYKFNLDTKSLDFLICPPENDSTQRFNDGKCDPAGRFWMGTMSLIGEKRTSHLFCLNSDGTIQVKLEGISTSNGIVWSADGNFMYYIDTPTRKVMEFAYDIESGDITSPRVAVNVSDTLGYPDGMTIDANGNLWVAMWGGASVCCFDPKSGELINRINVPAKNVTSCAFGGSDLSELYITTARIGTSDEDLKLYPNAGCLFKISLYTTGLEAFYY